MRSLRSIIAIYPEASQSGLSSQQVEDSFARHGYNRLTPLPRVPAWQKFRDKFEEPIITILLAASLLKIVVDLFEANLAAGLGGLASVLVLFALRLVPPVRVWIPTGAFALAGILVGVSSILGNPSIEGLAVMIAVGLATGVSFLSEYRSDREFEALNVRKEGIKSTVLRDGVVREVLLEDLAVGDLVILAMGDEIPADGRLVEADDLTIDQSLMTGESEPQHKQATPWVDETDGSDHPGCVYRGTQVVSGAGRMVVAHVGDDTMLGQIARRLSASRGAAEETTTDAVADRVSRKLTVQLDETPLQHKLAVLAGLISKVGYVASVAIFVALLIRGIVRGDLAWPGPEDSFSAIWLGNLNHLLEYFVYMVIVIVVAVPEGLPMSVTVSLALAMRKMTRSNALVRQLVATETIGSATVICTDKTGTLTQNRMTVEKVHLGGALSNHSLPPGWPVNAGSAFHLLVLNASVNSTAHLGEGKGIRPVIGNTTEGALLNWIGAGLELDPTSADSAVPRDYQQYRDEFPVVFRIHFSSERKRMLTVVEWGSEWLLLVKGAPETILQRSTHRLTADGRSEHLSERDITQTSEELATAARQAMRTLGFAQRSLPKTMTREQLEELATQDELEQDLTFLGFVGIRDPLRKDVQSALKECRAAGIDVKMITGDNEITARAIAEEAGLVRNADAEILTSRTFNALSDEELKARMPGLHVLARATPLDKYRLVRLLQEQNQVVAMTGDGTNDAPSLRKADVGLAMGRTGTEVAKEASEIVLLDDAFSTIVKAVHWGRALYENIQKFILFQLTINVSALAIALIGPLIGLRPPFTVLQLLWINVIMDTFAAIALCSEPPRPGLMTSPPKRRDENILTRSMVMTIGSTAIFFVVVMMGLLVGMQHYGWFAQPPTGDVSPASQAFLGFTVRQVTIFFSVYVFFQVWNQINCRSLTPNQSGLSGVQHNPVFLAITGVIILGQLAIVSYGGTIFQVEPLSWQDWLLIAAVTSSVIVYAEVVRLLRRVLWK